MATKVLVPLLGEGVEEVTVTKWLKREGETVNELDPLLEVNTDKVDTEIPAPATGTVLKIVAQEGRPARVGEILAYIGNPGEKLEASIPAPSTTARLKAAVSAPQLAPAGAPSAAAAQPTPAAAPATPQAKQSAFVSPIVARLAAEHGIDLSRVSGTGLNGRVTKADILRYVESGAPAAAPAAQPNSSAPGDELRKHTVIRRQIAEHMVLSQKTSPHVLTVMEADMSAVVAHRTANKETFARDGANLTYTAYFMVAIVAGLKAHPLVNSAWEDEGVLVHRAINLGMATSLGAEGLIVPVIKSADGLSLLAMARAVNDLAARAREKKLRPDDVKGGTFTLTNHGISGSLFALPIINQPQSGILGTGAMQKRPVVIGDAISIRPMVYLSFVFDHRILDGGSADNFLSTVKDTLERWS